MDNTRELELWRLVNKAFQNSIEKFGDIFAKDVTRDLLANGVTVQKWIPVTERLTELRERVLVYHDDGMIRFGINYGGFADVVSSIYLNKQHHTPFSKVTH